MSTHLCKDWRPKIPLIRAVGLETDFYGLGPGLEHHGLVLVA